MQQQDLLREGLVLMGLGMVFVFVFLTILVLSMMLMSTLLNRFQPPVGAASNAVPRPATSTPTSPDDETLAVISAAVHRYRAARRS